MSYFPEALTGRRNRTIELAKKFLTPRLSEFTSIAYTGMSGSLVAPILAYEFDKVIVPIRKSGERSHSEHCPEIDIDTHKDCRVLLVDDFIALGTTLDRMILEIHKWDRKATIIGIYCYSETSHMTRPSRWAFPIFRPEPQNRPPERLTAAAIEALLR